MVIAILSDSLPNLIAYTEILLNYAKLIFSEKWQIQPKKKKKPEVSNKLPVLLWRSERDLNPRAAFDRLLP